MLKLPASCKLSMPLFCFLFCAAFPVLAQLFQRDPGPTIQAQSGIFLDDLFRSQRPYVQSQYGEINGSAYLSESWKEAVILLKSGQQFNNAKIKLNLYTHELTFLTQSGKEALVREGVVHSFTISDTDAMGNVRAKSFITGLKGAESDSERYFFEGIADGKASLLRLTKKKIVNNNSALSPGDSREFQDMETYYIWFNDELRPCEKNADFYVLLFSDQKEKIKSYINSSGLKLKKPEDIQKLVEFYNSL
jgi:hypothetical protein